MTEQTQVSTPPQEQIKILLEEFTKRAAAGKLTNIAIAFTTREGVADVYSSPMSPVSMGHLSRLFERRVNMAYDTALRSADKAKRIATSPTGSVKSNSPAAQVAAQLPRKVRRQVLAAAKRANKHKNGKKPAVQPPSVIDNPGKPQ